MDINKILKQAEELAVYANKVERERDEAIARLAAMEAELYALKGQAAGVWDSAPSHSQQSALRITEKDALGIGASVFAYCRKRIAESWDLQIWLNEHGGRALFEKLNADRCPSHESEQP